MREPAREQSPEQEDTHENPRPELPVEPSSPCISVHSGSLSDPAATPPAEVQQPAEPIYSIFTQWEKRLIVLCAALSAFFSPLTGQIYFPALTKIAADLNVSVSQVNLTVTTYLIFQGLTPMFVGSFADVTGRRPAYIFCYVVYIGANIGCALAPNYVALLVLRMLQSAGASTTVALCQAVVADIITSAERGQYVGWTSVPIILAPSLGPVLGGLFAQYLGWRWIFWFLTILSGTALVLFLVFMPETCRTVVGDGSIRPHVYYRTLWQLVKDARRKRRARKANNGAALQPTVSRASTQQQFRWKRPNPLSSLRILLEKEMFLLLFYTSLVFAGFYALSTALPEQLSRLYGFNNIQIGLMYLPMAGGSVVAAQVLGKLSNWNYRRYCKKLGIPFDRSRQQDLTHFPIEKARLEISVPMLGLFTVAIIAWGWSFEYRAPYAVPCVLLFLFGFSLIAFSNAISILIVDIYRQQAGAATAANNLARCLVGAAATAAINPMIEGIGSGWAFTIFGFLYVAFFPAVWLVMKNGAKWRMARLEKEQKKMARGEDESPARTEKQEPRKHSSQEGHDAAVKSGLKEG
ncbi:major facilitator superfamily transporter [Xylariomycetidae sp. FL0641]|nr:major facilitator superfamily transporter [Xylariomycetidae sp. FL0641]